MEVNLRLGKPVLGDRMVAELDVTPNVLDKLTYPLMGSWNDKPACRPDQVSIINGYVCMYVLPLGLGPGSITQF